MNKKDLQKMEFIGLKIKIIESKNISLKNLKGIIVDETKNTFLIITNNMKKTLLKSQIKFRFKTDEKDYIIDGKTICFRPEERIKKIK
jgi:ribonuclease P protein subunit POP4